MPDIDTSDAGNSTDLAMSSKFEQYHQELDKLKLDLGGSPNYLGKRPKLRRGKKLFGLSIDTVRAWVSKALKKKWFPRPLFRMLGNHIGLGESGLTRYEYISLAIQSASKIRKHLPEIQARLVSNEGSCAFFNEKTGLTFHERLNKPEVLAGSLSDYLDLLEKHMNQAIRNGCLRSFFDEAIRNDDVCFEARMSRLLAYSASHTLDGGSVQFKCW